MFLQKSLVAALLVASATSFSPASTMRPAPFFVNVVGETTDTPPAMAATAQQEQQAAPAPVAPKAPKKKLAKKSSHKEGIFSPAVLLAKNVLGDKQLNEIRGKAIGLHSDVIGKFVETAETDFGNQVLKALFTLADKDQNGTIEEEELKEALLSLGFDLKTKQISGIFARADADGNGALDLDEWVREAPKTLRTNLIKLAKKNGGELGFLV
ncbi:MAG: hypothetical protein SGILL_004235 [Bacillariaceae sp.]